MSNRSWFVRHDLPGTFERSTGEHHPFQLRRRVAYVLEIEDLHFGHDSAVWVPHATSSDSANAKVPTGFDALRTCYLHAQEHPDRRILVVGHTDTTGSETYNVELSEKRADSLVFLLLGLREEWAKITHEKHRVDDIQKILQWVHRWRGWDCDPGPIDDREGPRTKKATEDFQKTYNREFGASISVDGIVGKQTWRAIFDLYIKTLAERLATTIAGLAEFRARLRFLDDARKAVGCGEYWPIEERRRNDYRSETNRRVEILFVETGQEPRTDCHAGRSQCDPNRCELYNPKTYRFVPIRCDASCVTSVFDVFFELSESGGTLEDRLRLVSEDGVYDRTLSRTDAQPEGERLRRIRFTEVPVGKRYTLFHLMVEGAPVVVFYSIPFERLNDFGDPTPEPEFRTARRLEPKSESSSDDTAVMNDPSWYGPDPSERGAEYA